MGVGVGVLVGNVPVVGVTDGVGVGVGVASGSVDEIEAAHVVASLMRLGESKSVGT